MKNKFLQIANSQVGYKEQKDGSTKYGEWYGIPKGNWCAMFVSWCANQTGVLNTKIPKYAGCGDGVRWFKARNQWTTIPKAGDILFIKPTSPKYTSSHTGIVYEVNGNKITTIEGNYNNKVSKVTRKINATNILGFGSVVWGDKNTYNGDFPKLPKRGYFYCKYDEKRQRYLHIDRGVEVKKLQQFLNWVLDSHISVDGEYGLNTKNAVIKFQKLVGISADGQFGKVSLNKAKEFTK